MPAEQLPELIEVLQRRGYQVVGPTLLDGVVRLRVLDQPTGLASGWADVQGPGAYRLEFDPDGPLFAATVGPDSPRTFLHPPQEVLFRARRTDQGLIFEPQATPERPLAFLGLRACDVAAREVQDRVLLERDPAYRARSEASLVVAVQCTRAATTCFCACQGAGPAVTRGADLVLTEVDGEFLVEAPTSRGQEIAAELRLGPHPEELRAQAADRVQACADSMAGRFEPVQLLERLEHPHWEAVAQRCLACANCTMVCPTCFCTDQVDTTDLEGQHERRRVWDSCFHPEFSLMAGRPVREGVAARYRQWLTHKLSSWQEQFGTSGCVGCGRCITWCPAGIDLREEARALQ